MKKYRFYKSTYYLVPGFFLLLLLSSCWPNMVRAQKIRVDNIRYELKESNIDIFYDLIGMSSKQYKVSVVLKREQDPSFSFKPVNAVGDVGKGYFAGEGRRIIWNYTNEFKPEAGVSDYYFEITAKKPGKTWLFVAGGVLVAGGATTAILLSGKKDSPAKTFPVPIRPHNP